MNTHTDTDTMRRNLALLASRANALPGSDLGRYIDEYDLDEAMVREWERLGWVRLAGEGVVLTQAGYRAY